jgi:hypothetical protein
MVHYYDLRYKKNISIILKCRTFTLTCLIVCFTITHLQWLVEETNLWAQIEP